MLQLSFSIFITVYYFCFCYALSSSSTSGGGSTGKSYIVKVCQSKTCMQQHHGGSAASSRSLVQLIQDLIPPPKMQQQNIKISVESSGCLSQCGYGPNLVVAGEGKKNETLYNHVNSPQAVAVILQDVCGIQVPKILLAASDVMRKAELGKETERLCKLYTANLSFLIIIIAATNMFIEPDATKSEILLNSVISALEKKSIDNEDDYKKSFARLSALTMRAKNRLVLQRYQDAIDDATRVVTEEISAGTTISSNNDAAAYRILAEAYEKVGNYAMAIQTLQKLSMINSAFITKANNEIKRIMSLE
jgi:(2Fe-2S) ferredoxin